MEIEGGGFLSSNNQQGIMIARSLRRLTCKQLNNAVTDESNPNVFLVDTTSINTVVLIGFVKSVNKTNAGVIFTLTDTTDNISCAFFTNNSYEEIQIPLVVEGGLIKVVGKLRTFNEKKSVTVTHVLECEGNDFIYHLTEAFYEYLFNTNVITPPKKKTNTNIESDVLSVFRNNQGDEGLEIDTVVGMLSGNYRETEIRDVINNLQLECQIYNVDDTKYKTTT